MRGNLESNLIVLVGFWVSSPSQEREFRSWVLLSPWTFPPYVGIFPLPKESRTMPAGEPQRWGWDD